MQPNQRYITTCGFWPKTRDYFVSTVNIYYFRLRLIYPKCTLNCIERQVATEIQFLKGLILMQEVHYVHCLSNF